MVLSKDLTLGMNCTLPDTVIAMGIKHCQNNTLSTLLHQADMKYSSSQGRPAVMNAAYMLKRRESHMGCTAGFSAAQCCHLGSFHYLPSRASRVVDRMSSRVYIGNFSPQGNVFVGKIKQLWRGSNVIIHVAVVVTAAFRRMALSTLT